MAFGKMMADYVKEKQGCDTLATDEGFVVYEIRQDKVLHINNMYVKPEFRQTAKASAIMEELLSSVCKEKGLTMVTASCDHAQFNPETSMLAILKFKSKAGKRFKVLPEAKMTNYFMELL